ncbi:hypothetical protein [Gimesia panareensis]|uniref:hypothetical protein n=1 Tax=Gimesia panareensis TaxID=2527978 RepID=UPI001187F272|nr:hypothetical protein [Gimesia panareensis]QDU49583.1 hypothetical protein Pan110_19210 [Gimesia panareensis]
MKNNFLNNVLLDQLVAKHRCLVENFGFDLEVKKWFPYFGGSVCLKYRSESLSVLVTKGRDGIGYDVGNGDSAKEYWYSIDILWNYLQGNDEYKKMEPNHEFDFITEQIEWLREVFSSANQAETEARLHELELSRSRILFG